MIHLPYGRCQQAPEGASETGASEEEGISFLGFGPLIPHTNQVERAREHASLGQTQEEAGSEQTTEVLHQPLAYRYQSKYEHTSRKPDTRLQLLQQDIRWYLKCDIRHEEDCQSGVVLIARQVQIIL